MSVKQSRLDFIFDCLENGPATAHWLAKQLDCPEASVRRDIGKLRSEGWDISTPLPGGQYELYSYRAAERYPFLGSVL